VIASAAALAGWWPFLLASVLFYGLIPRCLLLAFATLRMRAATRSFLLDDPQVHALLDRMSLARVELGAAEREEDSVLIERPLQARVAPVASIPATAIVWSSALPETAVETWVSAHLSWRVTEILQAGGAGSLADDQATIDRLAREHPRAVLILVRAWEAPLLDLRDFLAQLRNRVNAACTMIVVPVGPEGTTATQTQCTTWSKWIAAISDPALYVETGS
jgi:hypothetical protein